MINSKSLHIVLATLIVAVLLMSSRTLFFHTPENAEIEVNITAVYKIPKVLYQTWFTKSLTELTNTTREVMMENKKLNPDIHFKLWDDADVEHFMKKEFTGEVYEAFKNINPKFGAAKADFFRYCVLYKHGGLYLDIKSQLRIPHIFGRIILPNDTCVLDKRKKLEPFRQEWRYGTYEQWFLAFAPGHPYLKRMIERMVRSIREKVNIQVEGEHKVKYAVMRITGPDALAAAIHDAIVDVGLQHREVDYKQWVKYSKVVGNPEYGHLKRVHYINVNDSFYLRN